MFSRQVLSMGLALTANAAVDGVLSPTGRHEAQPGKIKLASGIVETATDMYNSMTARMMDSSPKDDNPAPAPAPPPAPPAEFNCEKFKTDVSQFIGALAALYLPLEAMDRSSFVEGGIGEGPNCFDFDGLCNGEPRTDFTNFSFDPANIHCRERHEGEKLLCYSADLCQPDADFGKPYANFTGNTYRVVKSEFISMSYDKLCNERVFEDFLQQTNARRLRFDAVDLKAGFSASVPTYLNLRGIDVQASLVGKFDVDAGERREWKSFKFGPQYTAIDGCKDGGCPSYSLLNCGNVGNFQKEEISYLGPNISSLIYASGAALLEDLALEGVKNSMDVSFMCPHCTEIEKFGFNHNYDVASVNFEFSPDEITRQFFSEYEFEFNSNLGIGYDTNETISAGLTPEAIATLSLGSHNKFGDKFEVQCNQGFANLKVTSTDSRFKNARLCNNCFNDAISFDSSNSRFKKKFGVKWNKDNTCLQVISHGSEFEEDWKIENNQGKGNSSTTKLIVDALETECDTCSGAASSMSMRKGEVNTGCEAHRLKVIDNREFGNVSIDITGYNWNAGAEILNNGANVQIAGVDSATPGPTIEGDYENVTSVDLNCPSV